MLYDITVKQFSKSLRNLSLILDKAEAHATAKKFDSQLYLDARLALDQFAFVRQIQIACDTAKSGAARLVGGAAPAHEDNEKTLAALKERIEKTVAYLETLSEASFAGAAERRISQPRWEGKSMSGMEFAIQHMMPNFYFHITTAYSILRHNGVDVGKKDYLGPMPFKPASA